MMVGYAAIAISRLAVRRLRLEAGLAVVDEMLVRCSEKGWISSLNSEISVSYLVPRSTTTSS